MQPEKNYKALIVAAIILGVALWPKIGPIVKEKFPNVVDWIPSVVTSQNPFDTPQLKVLVIYDTEKPPTEKQEAIINGTAVRSLVEAAKGKFYAFDVETEFVNEPHWAEVKKVIEVNKETSRPWIAIGNANTGTVEALPADVNATETLIRKYL